MTRNAIGPLAAARGWSDGELARRATVDRAHLNLLKNGRRQPTVATAVAIAAALGVPVADAFPAATSCRHS